MTTEWMNEQSLSQSVQWHTYIYIQKLYWQWEWKKFKIHTNINFWEIENAQTYIQTYIRLFIAYGKSLVTYVCTYVHRRKTFHFCLPKKFVVFCLSAFFFWFCFVGLCSLMSENIKKSKENECVWRVKKKKYGI